MSTFAHDVTMPLKREEYYPDLSEDGAFLNVSVTVLNTAGRRFELVDSLGNLAAVTLGPVWGPVGEWIEVPFGPMQGAFKITSDLGVFVRRVVVAPVPRGGE